MIIFLVPPVLATSFFEVVAAADEIAAGSPKPTTPAPTVCRNFLLLVSVLISLKLYIYYSKYVRHYSL
jgi:hypothetical protein